MTDTVGKSELVGLDCCGLDNEKFGLKWSRRNNFGAYQPQVNGCVRGSAPERQAYDVANISGGHDRVCGSK